MKKIAYSVIMFLLINTISLNFSHADEIKNKLYKSTITTSFQIKKDYGTKVNTKIVTIFKKFRYTKNTTTLNKLEIVLKKKIQQLNNKNLLKSKEKKKLNLYNNLYYRTLLLLNYNLK